MSNLSVTSGEFRGRKLHAPDTAKIHPMGSREKMALFNSAIAVLGPLEGVERVLDAYCGSGALGIEAISRGAQSAIFVDSAPEAIHATKENVLSLDISGKTEVIKSNIKNFTPVGQFGLILLDPPYDDFHPEDFSHLGNNLSKNGLLVLSHPEIDGDPAQFFPNLAYLSTKSAARARISFFQAK